MNLLFVNSSSFGMESKSRQVSLALIAAWCARYPQTTVIERDLCEDPPPHLTKESFIARSTAEESLTSEQRMLRAAGDEEIARVEAADVIVIAAPMYNYAISSALKAWIDRIVVAGRTFKYEESGPKGLLTGKKVFVVSARGGFYSDGAALSKCDFNEPYLRCILGFIGLADLQFVNIEGLAMGEQVAAAAMLKASTTVTAIVSAVANNSAPV